MRGEETHMKKSSIASSIIKSLLKENSNLREENRRLVKMNNEKDAFFMEMISDGLRHGSKLAAKHMADRKNYLGK